MTTFVLSCLVVAAGQMHSIQKPVDEWAMATVNHAQNGIVFEGTVVEGKLNSVSIEVPAQNLKTFSYSVKDYNQKSLTTVLDWKENGHASIDCEIEEARK